MYTEALGDIQAYVNAAMASDNYEGHSVIYLPHKLFFIFQCSPLITQYSSPKFGAMILSPGKKSFYFSSNQVVTASLTSSSVENRLPKEFFS